ncbi:MAG TPA: molecular chaperone DnaJ [Candidatus Magasanikbacteria bacterium]|nr:molecular chaperone DnaJ [Candidatus Magasanikbacteria bacterium]
MGKDYYKILGVNKNASQDEIRKAFQKMAHQYHPDKQGGDEVKFKEANEAYQVLGNEQKRKQYDQFGADFEQQGGFGGGMGWEDFMRAARGQGGGDFNFNFGGNDFGDIFGDLFGFGSGSRGRGGRARGRDIEVDVELDFKEAAFGIEKELNLRKKTVCDVCNGNGAEPGSKLEKCATCGGHGQVLHNQRTIFGTIQQAVVCPDCHGQGQKPNTKCKHCGGDGVVTKNNVFKVKIPAGINDGESIRLTGYGEASPYGGVSGDLYVHSHIKKNKYFSRDGYDILTDCEISFPQAVLGDKVEIETLDGMEKIMIPEGVESGQMIRLKAKGIPYLRQKGRGDHYVKIKIRVPKHINRDLKKKLEDLKNEL